jgi:alpha-ketoglutarate-dependent taurine dioxygenase
MSYETINVTPVTARIGANIEGISLAKPLSNHQVEELHQALADHLVLFFRNQPLDEESHKRLGRHFGDLHIHPNTPGPAGHPEILPIHADANSKRINGERWHSDVSCDEEPPLGSILYLHTVPPVGETRCSRVNTLLTMRCRIDLRNTWRGSPRRIRATTSIDATMCSTGVATARRSIRRHRTRSSGHTQ